MSEEVKTTCPYCGVGCGMRVTFENGHAQIRPDEQHPANYGRVCTKGAALGETIDLEGRALQPRLRGRAVDWDTALDTVANGFSQAVKRYGPDSVAFYVSGQLLTEDYYVANKLMKGFIGSANIDTNSRLCMSSAVAGHQRAFGEDLVPGCYEDLELADLMVLVGGNSAWCHPVLFQRIQAARELRPDMKMIVIDPRRTATAEMADLHLPIKPGTDVDLFNGLFNFLAEQELVDADFIEKHTVDYLATREACASYTIDEVAANCDLARHNVELFYQLFAQHERAVSLFSQGVNQSSAGTDKVNAITNCHLVTNRIGKPGSGPFSLTGQPNAMGGREVGGLANTLAAHMGFEPDHVDRVKRFWDSERVTAKPGLKAVDMFREIEAGNIKAVWIMATNPVVSLPDADAVKHALATCELVVVSDCTDETDTTEYADVLLPAAAWGEKDGTVTNSERRISRQRAFLPLPGEARPDWWIISEVARRMGYADAFPYDSPAQIFREHASLSAFENEGKRVFNIGGLVNLSAADYDNLMPIQWPVTTGNPSGTRRLLNGHDAGEFRPLRFVPLCSRPPVNATDERYPFILNSGRIRDHWHTLTRTGKSPRLNRHLNEPFVAVHPDDGKVLGLQEGYLAEVETRWGKLIVRVSLDDSQRRGEIFVPIHWSGQFSDNARVGALVNPVVDPVSGEPELKYTPARVDPLDMAWFGFVMTRQPAQPDAINGLDYWVKIRGYDHWRLEIAGRETQSKWGPWARRLLGAVRPDADWLEFADKRAGIYRLARVGFSGCLEACLMLAPRPDLLPDRSWLSKTFGKIPLDVCDRQALLAGWAPASGISYGFQVTNVETQPGDVLDQY